jgi:hypothetical protein
MNDTQVCLLAIAIPVLFIALFLVKRGYVKQVDKINLPAAMIFLGIAFCSGILAWPQHF